MSFQTELQQLSDDVITTFGESVTVTRNTSAGFDTATGSHLNTTVGPITLTADVQPTRQYADGGGSGMVLEEVVFLFDVVAMAATDLLRPKEKDLVTHGGFARTVCGFELQVGGKMWRVVCRDEKKRG